jgi:hypothetical protein
MSKTTLELSAETLELPESAYETAVSRYEDLGEFLSKHSSIKQYDPEVFSQGSFRIGTAIKPIAPTDPYDLDLTCKFTTGISTSSITQKRFKELVGIAIDEYIAKRGIKEPKEQKHRCWRIEYQDALSFHMDIVPGIKMGDTSTLRESMIKSSISAASAVEWANLAYNITDDRSYNYEMISSDWNISNPEGYARWFESRMKINRELKLSLYAEVKKIKTFELKTVLQRCIQILKKHRDIMFKHQPDLKPISIIITTLAALAYNGESTLEDALSNIVEKMRTFIKSSGIRIANPARPDEDFADKWKNNPALEYEFTRWNMQARADFGHIINSPYLYSSIEKVNKSLNINLNESMLENAFTDKSINIQPKHLEIDDTPPRPHLCK